MSLQRSTKDLVAANRRTGNRFKIARDERDANGNTNGTSENDANNQEITTIVMRKKMLHDKIERDYRKISLNDIIFF